MAAAETHLNYLSLGTGNGMREGGEEGEYTLHSWPHLLAFMVKVSKKLLVFHFIPVYKICFNAGTIIQRVFPMLCRSTFCQYDRNHLFKIKLLIQREESLTNSF